MESILKGGVSKTEEKSIAKIDPSQESISQLWKEYLEYDKDQADSYFMSYAVTASPVWREPNIIFFSLNSNLAQSALKNNKQRFIPFLQERLDVQDLDFQCEVEFEEPEGEGKKTETVVDRLIEIKEQNPVIDSLIKALDLDFYKNE